MCANRNDGVVDVFLLANVQTCYGTMRRRPEVQTDGGTSGTTIKVKCSQSRRRGRRKLGYSLIDLT